MTVTLHEGDSLAILPTLDENSIDAVVTDPPYHLTQLSRGGSPRINDTETPFGRTRLADKGFMGKVWDGGDVAFRPETWAEVLRVLKPGGYLLSFGGCRTYHRMVCAIEDAGFEIREQISYIFGSGFPKSLNVSKAIDAHLLQGNSHSRSLKKTNETRPGEGRSGASLPNNGVMAEERHVHIVRDEPSTPEAKKWQGWGTSLKPAHEPIVVARKPLIGTVAANVLQHGVGGLNIDACRVATENRPLREVSPFRDDVTYHGNSLAGRVDGSLQTSKAVGETNLGRWPANLMHDGSDEVEAAFAEFGERPSCMSPSNATPEGNILGGRRSQGNLPMDSGTASRFFYSSKASKVDRAGSKHPTVKPISLMRYLCKLVTPYGGTVLDPFAGSGTTGQAAVEEGFDVVLIEREAVYCEDIRRRLKLEIDSLFSW